MRALPIAIFALAACSRGNAPAQAPGPDRAAVTEVIVTADGIVECADDGVIRASDLRGC